MEILIVLGLFAVASALLLLGWRRLRSPRAGETPRDDTLRVGDDASATPEQAAKRAGDRSAWMIPSGF